MGYKCEKFLERVEEKTGVTFHISKNGKSGFLVEGEYWSDLGEDVIICLVINKLTKEEIKTEMYNYWQDFDAEEHAAELFNMHGACGTPTSLRALLKDANEQDEKLEQIFNVMEEL